MEKMKFNFSEAQNIGRKSSKNKNFDWNLCYDNWNNVEKVFGQKFESNKEIRTNLRLNGGALLENKFIGLIKQNNKDFTKAIVSLFVSIENISDLKKIMKHETVDKLELFINKVDIKKVEKVK